MNVRSPAGPVTKKPTSSKFTDQRLVPSLVLLLLILFAVVVAVRLDAFDVTSTVVLPGDMQQTMFVTFAGVDHPFHATRAATLLESLQEGRIPRWMGNHQGGYPAEFYPLGGPWLDVIVWGALFGTVPIVVVHKLVVLAVFLLPLVGFYWLARTDLLPGAVAVTAGAAHLAVPGANFQGGAYGGDYRELVSWGLVTNVTAAVEAFLVVPALILYASKGRPWAGAFAAGGAALAIATNPRSAIALVAIGLGVGLAMGMRTTDRSRTTPLVRLGVALATSGCLAAPVVVSLIRYDDLYYFVRYSGYATVADYVAATVATSSVPVLLLAVVGIGWAYGGTGRLCSKSVSLTTLIYVGATAALTVSGAASGPFQQLELTRLMPFQRLLFLYLAGVGVHAVAVWTLGAIRASRLAQPSQLALGAVVFVGFVFAPFGGLDEEDRGVFHVPMTDVPSMASVRSAVERADVVAPPGSSVYVVGSALSWHQQLWTPLWTSRPVRYNDWLWSWQGDHQAPGYSVLDGNAYRPATVWQTFDQAFLSQEGIGAVVVTGSDAIQWADSAPALRLVADGLYRVYDVIEPGAVLTVDHGTVDKLVVEDERITAQGTSNGDTARVRVNWHPRWQATINGRSGMIVRTPDGYMAVQVPPGDFDLAITYGATWWDWFGRALAIVGLLLVVGMLTGLSGATRRPRPTVRSGRR